MNRASRLSKNAQTTTSHQTPELSQSTKDILGAPALPRGQMPIEEVFKMMWARMNFLENALKDKSVSNSSEGNSPTISDLQGEPSNQFIQSQQDPVAPLYDESILEEIKSTLPDHEAKINTLAQEVGSIKKSLGDTISNFNNSMQAIGADLTEMNNKYTQMNNFLMEIQTTQITVNNQILKHYNDNNSDLIETQITQSADEKFNAKDSEETTEEEVKASEDDNGEEITTSDAATETTEQPVIASTVETANSTAIENVSASVTTPKQNNNVTFNIE